MSLMLFDDLITRLTTWNVLTGIILAVIGLAVAFLAKKITKIVRKSDVVATNDNIYLILKAFGLIMVVVALILMIIK